ncbi:MAG: DUF3187 family protein [Thiovulaceae bacterium]|nr:DUF3187 family protein [Sulfurimonadaceae bacterium]
MSLSLFAYSDLDMDGVDDLIDQCPNTPLTELVDIKGCTVRSLESPHHYDIIMGASYSQIDYNTQASADTLTGTLQVDYYYKSFSLLASTSYYRSDSQDSGLNDSFIGAYYQLTPSEALSLRLGVGVVLPTYDSGLNNNNTDYSASASLSYTLSDINLFGSYSYTLINDDDIQNVVYYQNTNGYSAGIGFYPTDRLYTSVVYNSSDSIYQNVEAIESASAYLFYTIDSHWFATLNYAYGLSDSASDHYGEFCLGYYF